MKFCLACCSVGECEIRLPIKRMNNGVFRHGPCNMGGLPGLLLFSAGVSDFFVLFFEILELAAELLPFRHFARRPCRPFYPPPRLFFFYVNVMLLCLLPAAELDATGSPVRNARAVFLMKTRTACTEAISRSIDGIISRKGKPFNLSKTPNVHWSRLVLRCFSHLCLCIKLNFWRFWTVGWANYLKKTASFMSATSNYVYHLLT